MYPAGKSRKSSRFYGLDWLFAFLVPTHILMFVLEIKFHNIEAAWAWLNLLFIDAWFWSSARSRRSCKKSVECV